MGFRWASPPARQRCPHLAGGTRSIHALRRQQVREPTGWKTRCWNVTGWSPRRPWYEMTVERMALRSARESASGGRRRRKAMWLRSVTHRRPFHPATDSWKRMAVMWAGTMTPARTSPAMLTLPTSVTLQASISWPRQASTRRSGRIARRAGSVQQASGRCCSMCRSRTSEMRKVAAPSSGHITTVPSHRVTRHSGRQTSSLRTTVSSWRSAALTARCSRQKRWMTTVAASLAAAFQAWQTWEALRRLCAGKKLMIPAATSGWDQSSEDLDSIAFASGPPPVFLFPKRIVKPLAESWSDPVAETICENKQKRALLPGKRLVKGR
mmetsp:Transcript_29168/g.69656  ORF Transcript_29168/g.69656 Transcript_29168/m.69656 type:complete len:324 (+) Transcript_29168:86-1057(+)